DAEPISPTHSPYALSTAALVPERLVPLRPWTIKTRMRMRPSLAWLRRHLTWSNSRQSWQERIALVALLAIAFSVVWFRDRLSPGQELVLWALLATGAAALSRRGWLRLFGPILFFDLVRIARQRRYFLLRALYGLLLALFLFWIYLAW